MYRSYVQETRAPRSPAEWEPPAEAAQLPTALPMWQQLERSQKQVLQQVFVPGDRTTALPFSAANSAMVDSPGPSPLVVRCVSARSEVGQGAMLDDHNVTMPGEEDHHQEPLSPGSLGKSDARSFQSPSLSYFSLHSVTTATSTHSGADKCSVPVCATASNGDGPRDHNMADAGAGFGEATFTSLPYVQPLACGASADVAAGHLKPSSPNMYPKEFDI